MTECIEYILLSVNNFLIGGFYPPPRSNVNDFLNEFENLLKIVNMDFNYIFLGGDFNLNILSNDNIITNFRCIIALYGLKVLNNSPTRITPTLQTCLDLGISNENYHLAQTLNYEVADHLPVLFTCSTQIYEEIPNRRLFKINVSKPKLQLLGNILQYTDWTPVLCSIYPNLACEKFYEIFMPIYDEIFDITTTCNSNRKKEKKPWITKSLIKKIRKRKKKFKKFLNNPTELNHEDYKNCRNSLITEIRNTNEQYYKNLIKENWSKLDKRWNIIRPRSRWGQTRHLPRVADLGGGGKNCCIKKLKFIKTKKKFYVPPFHQKYKSLSETLKYHIGQIYEDSNMDASVRDEASGLLNQIKKFKFSCSVLIWYETLNRINIVSKLMQSIDLRVKLSDSIVKEY